MINLSSNSVVKIQLSNPFSLDEIERWMNGITAFLSGYLEDKDCSLFEYDVQSYSILQDLPGKLDSSKIWSDNYAILTQFRPTKDLLNSLIGYEGFYLGNIILVVGNITDSDAQILSTTRNIVETDLEIFTLKDDGLCFYWINPKVINPQDVLNEAISAAML